MKNTILTTLIAAATIFVAATPAADAQRYHRHQHHQHQSSHIFVSGYHSCGTPIYTERYIIRYDRYRRPVYGHRVIRHRRHHHVRPAPRGYRVAPCPPPRYHHGHHGRSRSRSGGYINIRF